MRLRRHAGRLERHLQFRLLLDVGLQDDVDGVVTRRSEALGHANDQPERLGALNRREFELHLLIPRHGRLDLEILLAIVIDGHLANEFASHWHKQRKQAGAGLEQRR